MSPQCKCNEEKKPPPVAAIKEPNYFDLAYRISVMQAALDGKQIEYQDIRAKWSTITKPSWNWDTYVYRVKKEPFTARVLISRETGIILDAKNSSPGSVSSYLNSGWELITVVEKE